MSKASKQRSCPALGRNITPGDCGEQRQSSIACPADCPHNPFAPVNYSRLLEIEERLDAKTLERFSAQAPAPGPMENEFNRANLRSLHGHHAFFVWQLFFATDANNTTFARHWEQAGWTELKNDERVLLRAKMRMRIVLIEIQRVLPNGRVEAVDLLSSDPTPMILQDRGLAGVALRFATYLTWSYPMPHYWRMSGTATTIPDLAQFSPREIVGEITRHLGGPLTEAEMRRWLAEHFLHFDEALHAVSRARRRQMFAGMDAKWGRAVYELRAPFAECRERLDAVVDLEPDSLAPNEQAEGFAEARVWFDPIVQTKHLTAPGGRIILGRVLLGQSMWRLETMGADKLSRLRREFENQLGGHARFTGERVDDMAAQLAAKEPAVDQTLVPPRLLENPDQFTLATSRVPAPPPGASPGDAESELMLAAERAFLNEAVPALDNRTPREAARDPALRTRLIQLMKQRVRSQDERNLQTGRIDDINWLLRELDLTEIIFDPPPWRPTPAPAPEAAGGWSEPADFEEEFEVDPNRPPAPGLPEAPFDLKEATKRLQNALDWFASAAEAEDELDASGATLLFDAQELTLDSLSEDEFAFAIPLLLQAWFALVPRGCRAPEIDFTELETALASNLHELLTCAEAGTPKKLEAFLQSGPQPGLMLALLADFLGNAKIAPKKLRPDRAAEPVILALLKAVVEKLDEALRRG